MRLLARIMLPFLALGLACHDLFFLVALTILGLWVWICWTDADTPEPDIEPLEEEQ